MKTSGIFAAFRRPGYQVTKASESLVTKPAAESPNKNVDNCVSVTGLPRLPGKTSERLAGEVDSLDRWASEGGAEVFAELRPDTYKNHGNHGNRVTDCEDPNGRADFQPN